jgi:hypothetical protein
VAVQVDAAIEAGVGFSRSLETRDFDDLAAAVEALFDPSNALQ